MGLLDGRVALITGAGAGIGRAVARRFAAEGAVLWLNERQPDAYEHLTSELAEAGVTVGGSAGDATDSSYVNEWVAQAVETHGRIDVLYNNVGVSRSGLVGDTSDDDWRFQQRLTLDLSLIHI